MAQRINQKGFMLLAVLLFTSLFAMISGWILVYFNTVKARAYTAEKKQQATNLASEGLELAKGYMISATNKDKVSGWQNIVAMNGKYVFRYANWYVADRKDSETIERDLPYSVDYVRTIEITNDPDPDQKKISVSVDYGSPSSVQFSTTITNLYGK